MLDPGRALDRQNIVYVLKSMEIVVSVPEIPALDILRGQVLSDEPARLPEGGFQFIIGQDLRPWAVAQATQPRPLSAARARTSLACLPPGKVMIAACF